MQGALMPSNIALGGGGFRHSCQVAVAKHQLLHTSRKLPRHNRVRVAAAQAAHTQDKPVTKRLLRKKGQTEHPHTILAIDGGGMRGMIPACVLEQIEQSIKEGALDLLKNDPTGFAEVLSFEAGSFQEDMPTSKEIEELTVDKVKVDLADFFDLLSGTSTGAILAAFLATKGGACEEAFLNPSDDKLKERYKESVNEFKTVKGIKQSTDIVPGSAASAQVLFAAVGDEIFTKFGGWLNPANWSLNPFKDATGTAERLAWKRLYGDEGIERVLKDILRKTKSSSTDTTATADAADAASPGSTPQTANPTPDSKDSHFIQLKDDDCLHTSLLIPSFQIDHNRPVMFWHLHRPESPWGSSWGYSTLHRLKPFEGLEEMSVKDDVIVDAVATAMAELLSAKLEVNPPLTADQIKRAPVGPEDDPILNPSADEIAGEVAASAYKALEDVPGFTQASLKYIILGALQLLREALRADPETRRKMPLVQDTFKSALAAMIVPALRPDMLTAMYVLKEPKPEPKPALNEPEPAAEEAPPADRSATKRLSEGLKSAAASAGRAASTGYKAIKSRATAANAKLRGKMHEGDLQYHDDEDQPAPVPDDALQQDLQWAADKAAAAADKAAAAAAAKLPSALRGALFGREFDGVQEACRFYEAQCGDSLHIYDVNFNLWEVVRASTAAPTFFAAAFLTSLGVGKPSTPIVLDKRYQQLLQGHFADGGVVANNPTLAAIAFMERAYGVERQNMAVLSLGCGSVTGALDVGQKAGGLGWVGPLMSQVFMGSSIDTVTAIAEMVFTADGKPDKVLPCGQSPPCEQAQQAQGRTRQGASRYLRIQAVGFAPSEMDRWDRLQVRLGFKTEADFAPKLKIVTPSRTEAPKPGPKSRPPSPGNGSSRQIRREVNYLAIDPTPSAAPVDTREKFTNVELRDALQEMDRPQDWEKLLVIGNAVSNHFSEDIRAWVDQHILLNRGSGSGSNGSTPTGSREATPEPETAPATAPAGAGAPAPAAASAPATAPTPASPAVELE